MNCHLCCRDVSYPITCHRKDTEQGALWECCECKGHGFFSIKEINFKCCSQMNEEEQKRSLEISGIHYNYYKDKLNFVC